MTLADISKLFKSMMPAWLRAAFSFIWISVWLMNSSSAKATSGEGLGDGTLGHILSRRALSNSDIRAPNEQCFSTMCNRVTHYCDKVIESCVSCEDDCHPSRINGDEVAIRDCQKSCDWYYYIKSLKSSPEESVTQATEHPAENEISLLCKNAFLTIIVVSGCFTVIILVMFAIFICCFKRLSQRKNIIGQETGTNTPSNSARISHYVHSLTPSGTKRTEGKETSLKLLAGDEESNSLSVRTGQQESVVRSFYDQDSFNFSSRNELQKSNKSKQNGAQIHSRKESPSESPAKSSTCPLV